MTHLRTILAGAIAASLFAVSGLAQRGSAEQTRVDQGKVERGKQLTEQVAKCQDCHTRRTATGELDRSAWLRGVEADPVKAPAGKLPVRIPDITAEGTLWVLWGEKGMLEFLERGTSLSGAKPSVHMPSYKRRHDDAEAIVTYLKSLRRE